MRAYASPMDAKVHLAACELAAKTVEARDNSRVFYTVVSFVKAELVHSSRVPKSEAAAWSCGRNGDIGK